MGANNYAKGGKIWIAGYAFSLPQKINNFLSKNQIHSFSFGHSYYNESLETLRENC